MKNLVNLKEYIAKQIKAGLQTDEIVAQLKIAGWHDAAINSAFESVRASLTPKATSPVINQSQPTTETVQPQNPSTGFGATGNKRGRLKTAWMLLKISLSTLRNNKSLVKYPFMGGLITLLVTLVATLIVAPMHETYIYFEKDVFGDTEAYLTPAGMVLAFIYYIVVGFVIFTYNAGLAAHVLDVFRGQTKDYKQYMKTAWSKKVAVFIYSVINSTVGLILHAIEQRSRWIGYIVSKLLGALWALANMFTIPIIVESDSSATSAIKESAKLFLSRWGENIGARIGFGGLAFLVYLLIFIPLIILTAIITSALGLAGVFLFISIFIIGIFMFIIIETAASQIVSTALYYYAKYQQIPGNFSPDLLNAALVPKKKSRFSKK